jgi:hypothetical protein
MTQKKAGLFFTYCFIINCALPFGLCIEPCLRQELLVEQYTRRVQRKAELFLVKTSLLILQHFKHRPLPSSLKRAQWYITYVSLDGVVHPRIYKSCSKKDRTFAIKTLLLILQHFKHCPLQSSLLYWR